MKTSYQANVIVHEDKMSSALERLAATFCQLDDWIVTHIEEGAYRMSARFRNRSGARIFVLMARPDVRAADVDHFIVEGDSPRAPHLEPEELDVMRTILLFHSDDEENAHFPFAPYKSLCAKLGVKLPG